MRRNNGRPSKVKPTPFFDNSKRFPPCGYLKHKFQLHALKSGTRNRFVTFCANCGDVPQT